MSEFFPVESKVTDLRVVRPGDFIEVREGDLVYCQERIDLVDIDREIIWIRGRAGRLEPYSARHFTFWRYVL